MKRARGAALGVVRVMAFGLLAGAVAESVSAEVNLLRDGGFEFDPGCTYDWHEVTELDAWIVESGNVDKICKYWVSHGGEQSLDLVGTADGIISQAFSTIPGQEYKLVVWYSGNPYDQGYRSARVDIVGGDVPSVVLGWDPEVEANSSADMGWRSHVVVFKAKGGAATLRLASHGGGGYGGIALDDISVIRYRGVALPAAETASVRPPEVSGDGRFDGSYFNSEFSFGFRISGNQGVTTVSNSPNYQVGDVMLTFVETSPTEFRGEQLCTDGVFHKVTGVLSAAGNLEMTIEGCSPTRYTMVRQLESGGATMDEASSLYQRLRAGDLPTTREVLSAAKQLAKVHGFNSIADPLLRDKLVQKAGATFLFDKVVDAFIDVVVEEMDAHGAFGPTCPFGAFCDRYVMTSFLRTGKNLLLLDVKAQIVDQVFLIAESWQETKAAIDNLPCIETLPAVEQEKVRDLYRIKGWIGSKFSVTCQRAW